MFLNNHSSVSRWVTTVTYTPDGRVISGGMDQKVCLWGINSSRCMDLIGHCGSISGVGSFRDCIVSSSYDKRVKIWNSTTGKLQGTLIGHRAPILQLVPSGCELIATGDRGGSTFIWDLAGECLSWRLKKIHKGHITAIRWMNEAQQGSDSSKHCHHFLTGGQDGVLRLWDIRDHSNVFKEKIHGGVAASASINEVLVHPSNSNLFITCGADQTMKVRIQLKICFKHFARSWICAMEEWSLYGKLHYLIFLIVLSCMVNWCFVVVEMVPSQSSTLKP